MLKDANARKTISEAVKLNLMVEAGAGSGKTEEMAKRILALIGTGYRRINEIVAITFTRKAANELRERIRTLLAREYDKSNNVLLKNALDHIHECFIGTVHSFCGKILRERPIEAGVDPDFEQIDDGKDRLARQKIWETYVLHADEADTEILRLMNVFDVKPKIAQNFLQKICENQDINFVLPNEPEIQLESLLTRVKDAAHELFQSINAHYHSIPDEVFADRSAGDDLQNSMIKFKNKLRHITINEMTDAEIIKLIKVFSTKSSVRVTLYKWGEGNKDYAKELKKFFPELREAEVVPLIRDIGYFVYNRVLLPFATKANDLYLKHKNTVGELNFQDLLIRTSNMLRDYPDVRTHFHDKYKTFLIDEFQDTDPIQVGITMYLTGEELTEKRWNMLTPKEGSLFVVGDPKQSIYKFRRADFSMYKRFKDHIVNHGGAVVELQTNFRASVELGNWYNESFPSLLSGENQAVFTMMDAVMPTLENTLAGVLHYRSEEKSVGAVMANDPEILTRIINHLVGRKMITVRGGNDSQGNPIFKTRPVRYSDIMILTRKKANQVEKIGNSIAELGIPVKITGADILDRTSEFKSFCDLIRMFAYPEENAYIHKVMKGDFFRFTDSEIYTFCHAWQKVELVAMRDNKFNLYFDFKEFFEENELSEEETALFKRIEACFGQLRRYLDYVKSLCLAAATERIIEELGIIHMHLASREKAAGLGSFISLIEKIRLKKITDIWGLDLFITELSAMIEGGFEEDVDIEGKDFDAVRVMNAHKAKGLEAAIVILCAPCSGGNQPPTFHTRCVVDENSNEQYFGYMRVDDNPDGGYARAKNYYEPAGWGETEGEAIDAEELERDRVLYVAATRAKNLLIIGDSPAKDNPWRKLMDLLPEDTPNILLEVYDGEGEAATMREPAAPQAIEKSIEDVKRFRDEAFNANAPSFGVYKPSEEINHVRKSDELSHEQEVTILHNTMEVIIHGEEVALKSDRLEIGTIIHRLFEVAIKHEEALPDTIDAIAEAGKDSFITKDFLEATANKFKNSDLYKRVKKSDAVYTEVPFSYKILANSDYAGKTFEQDTYASGIIDLVFKENGEWIIYDYKTYAETESSHDVQKMYEPQLHAYKEAWEKITNERVSETNFYFVMKRVAE